MDFNELYGLRLSERGVWVKHLLKREHTDSTYEQAVRMCADLPDKEFDTFAFFDGALGKWFYLDLN